jgi:hypothetical protein
MHVTIFNLVSSDLLKRILFVGVTRRQYTFCSQEMRQKCPVISVNTRKRFTKRLYSFIHRSSVLLIFLVMCRIADKKNLLIDFTAEIHVTHVICNSLMIGQRPPTVIFNCETVQLEISHTAYSPQSTAEYWIVLLEDNESETDDLRLYL